MLSRSSAGGRRSAVRRSPRAGRPGLTLLEVLISLAIFLLALAGIAQLIALGSDLAVEAQQTTEALQLAQAKLSQVVSGIIPLQANQNQADSAIPKEETPNQQDGWSWTLDCSQADTSDPPLWNVRVTVRRQRPGGSSTQVTLTQLVLDPSQRGTTQQPSSTDSGSGTSGTSQ
jgi:general secretion pathway protein I